MFYVVNNGKKSKQLDVSLTEFLTPESIAYWLCDDGFVRNGNSAFLCFFLCI
jgi:hypothetical protein